MFCDVLQQNHRAEQLFRCTVYCATVFKWFGDVVIQGKWRVEGALLCEVQWLRMILIVTVLVHSVTVLATLCCCICLVDQLVIYSYVCTQHMFHKSTGFIVFHFQLRLLRTTHSTIFLHVTSSGIIEDCSEMLFAPYNFTTKALRSTSRCVGYYNYIQWTMQDLSALF